MTESAKIGTAGDALPRPPISSNLRMTPINNIPVAFAVSYLVGVKSVVWFPSRVGPRVMRGDLRKACQELELEMWGGLRSSRE